MRPRNTLVLALLVAALGAFVYLYELPEPGEEAGGEEASEPVFPGLEAGAVEWLELRTEEDAPARLERSGEGGWRLTQPVDFPADDAAAEGIASALADLTSARVFEEPEAPEAYGLAGEPTLRFGTEEAEHALFVGDETPVGGKTYVRGDAPAPVYAVESFETNALQTELAALRDDRVLAFDRAEVRRIEVEWPEGSVVLVREGPDARWRLRAPLETRADAETVDTLLSDLRFLRADGFLDDPPSDAEAGLEEPALRVRLRGAPAEEGGEATLLAELAIGGSVGEGRLAARGKVEGVLYALSRSRLEAFPREVVAYRYKQLAAFDASRAERFELRLRDEGEDEAHVLEGRRGEEGWTTRPEVLKAGKAARLVRELADLEASDVVAESMGESERSALGLVPPRGRLRAWGAPEEEGGEAPLLADVALGRADPEQGIAAMRAGHDVVYRLDYGLAEHLPLSLEAFRNRFVAADASEAEAAPGSGAPPLPRGPQGAAPSRPPPGAAPPRAPQGAAPPRRPPPGGAPEAR